MERSGRTYYLNQEESKKLLKNDFMPDQENWTQRDRFLEEIERTMQDIKTDVHGGVSWRDTAVDEEKLSQVLERRNHTIYHTERLIFINALQVQEKLHEYTLKMEDIADKELVLA